MDDVKFEDPKRAAQAGKTADEDPNIPIDFPTFILSLSSSAAYHLGLVPHPEGEGITTCKNLPMAKQTIDILGILKDKTKGNLTGEEERILNEVLYNLRLVYVRASENCP